MVPSLPLSRGGSLFLFTYNIRKSFRIYFYFSREFAKLLGIFSFLRVFGRKANFSRMRAANSRPYKHFIPMLNPNLKLRIIVQQKRTLPIGVIFLSENS